jgi:hypothetical protein
VQPPDSASALFVVGVRPCKQIRLREQTHELLKDLIGIEADTDCVGANHRAPVDAIRPEAEVPALECFESGRRDVRPLGDHLQRDVSQLTLISQVFPERLRIRQTIGSSLAHAQRIRRLVFKHQLGINALL